jgi:hypothetical protein
LSSTVLVIRTTTRVGVALTMVATSSPIVTRLVGNLVPVIVSS